MGKHINTLIANKKRFYDHLKTRGGKTHQEAKLEVLKSIRLEIEKQERLWEEMKTWLGD